MTLGQHTVFNPPDWWNTQAVDPTQPPVMIYPGGSPGSYPYGIYPGYYAGQRTFTYEDMDRFNKERSAAMARRAEVSEDPSHKYLSAEGKLDPRSAAALQRAKKLQEVKQEDPIKKFQKRLVTTVLIGAVLSALLK